MTGLVSPGDRPRPDVSRSRVATVSASVVAPVTVNSVVAAALLVAGLVALARRRSARFLWSGVPIGARLRGSCYLVAAGGFVLIVLAIVRTQKGHDAVVLGIAGTAVVLGATSAARLASFLATRRS